MTRHQALTEGFVVLDYGSQYTLLITRRLREIGAFAVVTPGSSVAPPPGFKVHGIVLSGGPASVGEGHAIPEWVLKSGKPVLGICFGMQLLVEGFGGKVRRQISREYGKAHLKVADVSASRAASIFFDGVPGDSVVWMSHGDDAERLPAEFVTVGKTEAGVIAAIAHREQPIVGLQFHPEVKHSEAGQRMLANFVKLCAAPLTWKPDGYLDATTRTILETTGDSGRVLMAVSGGVDSTVAAVLLHKVLGPKRFTPVFVDNGLLRADEVSWVQDNFHRLGIDHLVTLSAAQTFLQRLKGVTDPEAKRKIIGRTFIEEFESYAKGKDFTHLGQGTLYPDVIESAGDGSGAQVIKTHHNVGGLPERLHLKLVEPFRLLFKDEVRVLGRSLGIDPEFLGRHPFPGPGLAVRVLGEVTEERLAVLRAADAIFIDRLKFEGFYDEVWQAFAVLLPVKTVGVMGDNRTYENTLALRAVTATDGMTAQVAELPLAFIQKTADAIIRNVRGVNRVVYDVTSKPPGTIEWE